MVELFHVIADPGSAEVRRFVVERELTGVVRFRNLHYPEVQEAFAAHGGKVPPALWDGERLFEGTQAVLHRLLAVLDVGRAP